MTKLPIYTIVTLLDASNKPVVLVGDESSSGYRLWLPYNGENKSELNTFVEWQREASTLYKDKVRSVEEMDQLRRIMISLATIGGVIDDPDLSTLVTTSCVIGVAHKWFITDNPDIKITQSEFQDDARAMVYINLVQMYIERFSKLVSQYILSGQVYNTVEKQQDEHTPVG